MREHPHAHTYPANFSRRRILLTCAAAGVGLPALLSSRYAQAIWIRSWTLNVIVNVEGAGQGEIVFSDGRETFSISALRPAPSVIEGFVQENRAPEHSNFLASGEVYFLSTVESFSGTYRRIEQNINMVSLTGVRGGLKFQNEHGVVIFLSGPSDSQQFDPGVQEIVLTLEERGDPSASQSPKAGGETSGN